MKTLITSFTIFAMMSAPALASCRGGCYGGSGDSPIWGLLLFVIVLGGSAFGSFVGAAFITNAINKEEPSDGIFWALAISIFIAILFIPSMI